MPVSLRFEIEGDVQLQRMLEVSIPAAMKAELKDFHTDAGSLVVQHSQELFQNSGAGIETAPVWAKLSPETVKAKLAKGYSSKPLIATGRLAGATKKQVDASGVTIYNEAMEDYGKYHQSAQPRTRLPRRAFLEIDNRTRSNIVRLLQVRIFNALNPGRATITSLR